MPRKYDEPTKVGAVRLVTEHVVIAPVSERRSPRLRMMPETLRRSVRQVTFDAGETRGCDIADRCAQLRHRPGAQGAWVKRARAARWNGS